MPSLLQSVFNTFYDYEVDIEKVTSHKFIQDYKSNFQGLVSRFGGLDWSTLDSDRMKDIALDEGRNWWGANMEAIGEGAKQLLGQSGIMVGAAGSPAAGIGTVLGGAVIDGILDAVAGWIEVDVHPTLRGDWVVVDKTGEFKRRRTLGVMSEQFDAPEAAKEMSEPGSVEYPKMGQNAHLGLCLGTDATEITVLDVETGITLTIPREYTKRVDQAHQEELNSNPILHAVKGSTESAKSYDQLLKETNVRVGDYVIYQNEKWEVARYSNEKVMITSNGVYEDVNWGDLSPALNDTTAQPVPPERDLGSFVSDAQGFNTGDWVFAHYPATATWHLGVVQKCRGTEVFVVSADSDDDNRWFKTADLNKWLMQPSTGKLGPFRIAVIEGKVNEIKSHRPDLNFAGIIAVPDEEATALFATKVVSAYQGEPITETVAEGLLARVPVADKTIEANAYREGLMGGGGDSAGRTQWGRREAGGGARRPRPSSRQAATNLKMS